MYVCMYVCCIRLWFSGVGMLLAFLHLISVARGVLEDVRVCLHYARTRYV
jgi:hypothetical protein